MMNTNLLMEMMKKQQEMGDLMMKLVQEVTTQNTPVQPVQEDKPVIDEKPVQEIFKPVEEPNFDDLANYILEDNKTLPKVPNILIDEKEEEHKEYIRQNEFAVTRESKGQRENVQDFNKPLNLRIVDFKDEVYTKDIDQLEAFLSIQDNEILALYLNNLMNMYNDRTHGEDYFNYTRNQLIDGIMEIHLDRFKEAMKSKGYEVQFVTEPQKELLKKYNYDGFMPITKRGASHIIEQLMEKQGLSKSPTASQIQKLINYQTSLNIKIDFSELTSSYKAGNLIYQLEKQSIEKFGEPLATDKQKDYYLGLLTRLGKKHTKKVLSFVESATSKALKEQIDILQTQYRDTNKASDKMIKMVMYLQGRYTMDTQTEEYYKSLSLGQVSDRITELQKIQLFNLTRQYQSSLTEEQINKMQPYKIQQMLKQIQEDKKDIF